MHMYHPHYLELARDLCTKYNIHLIADEVLVGFGRTGYMFACESANITPDFLVLSNFYTLTVTQEIHLLVARQMQH